MVYQRWLRSGHRFTGDITVFAPCTAAIPIFSSFSDASSGASAEWSKLETSEKKTWNSSNEHLADLSRHRHILRNGVGLVGTYHR